MSKKNHEGSPLLARGLVLRGRSICYKRRPEFWNHENLIERRLSLWLMES